MAFFMNHFGGFLYLFVGAALVVAGVQVFAKQMRSIAGMLACLASAAVFATVGLLDVLQLMAPELVGASENAVLGIFLILSNIQALYSPPSASHPNWTKWAMLVFGAIFVLAATFGGVRYYWR